MITFIRPFVFNKQDGNVESRPPAQDSKSAKFLNYAQDF